MEIGVKASPWSGLSFDHRPFLFWSFTAVLAAFVVIPLGLLVLNSLRQVSVGDLGFSLDNFTLGNYVEAYSNPASFKMLWNSFVFAVGSMVVALVFGGSLAFLSERTDLKFRKLIPVIVMVPLIMPSVVKGIAWIFLLSPQIGLLNLLWKGLGFESGLMSAYTLPAMIWVEGISMSSLAFLLIGATLRQMDPALEEAAFATGAPAWRVFLQVSLPLIAPALAGIAILLFIRGVETFEVPMLLGFSSGIFVFSTNIYYSLRSAFPPDYGLGFAYSMTLVGLTLLALGFYQRRLRSAEQFTVVTGRGYRPRLIHLGRWRYLAWSFAALYLLFAVALPLLILIWASLLPFYRPPSWQSLALVTLENYRTLLDSGLFPVIKNTVLLGGVSSMAIMLLALLASWFIYRTNIAGRKVLDFVVFLPYAVSGVAIGVAFMIFFLSFPNAVYNTIWIIVLAYIVNYLPIGTRFTNAAIVQVHKELEEAAWASGSGFWMTLWRVWVPLLTPALINGLLFVFILSFKVMSIAALLQGTDNMVLSVYLWRLWDSGDSGPAAALSLLLVGAMAGLTMIARGLGTRWAGEREP